jgi:quercetin dioxygenase-like cupin family protein
MRTHNDIEPVSPVISARAFAGLLAAGGWVLAIIVMAILSEPRAAVATPAKDFSSDFTKSFFERIRVLSFLDTGDDDDDRRLGRNPGDISGKDGLRDEHHAGEDAKVKIIAKEPSDVYVVTNTVLPGGYSGWHTHPGPSLVLVKTGTATVYEGDDPSCTPHTYPAGTGFVDAGGGHVHMVRNEGTEQLVTVAFQVIPAGDARRIEAANPGYCPF